MLQVESRKLTREDPACTSPGDLSPRVQTMPWHGEAKQFLPDPAAGVDWNNRLPCWQQNAVKVFRWLVPFRPDVQ